MISNFNFQETTLAFPFKISPKGTVSVITDQEAIWSNKVKSVIGTFLKERVMIPYFGSKLGQFNWNTEGFAKENVTSFVEEAFAQWLPGLTLIDVEISDVDLTGELIINISYELPNDTRSETTIGIIGISGTLQPTQETR